MTLEQGLVATFFALDLLVAMVWGTIGALLWRLAALRGASRTMILPLVALGVLLAGGYLVGAFLTLIPPPIHVDRPVWLRGLYLANSVCFVGAVAAFGHAAWRWPIGGPPPGRGRLVLLYGSAAAVLLLDGSLTLAATPTPAIAMLDAVVHGAWAVVVLGIAGSRIARVARSGAWNPDTPFVARRRDVAVVVVLAVAVAVMFALAARGGWSTYPWALHSVDVAAGLAGALPVAARMLGAVVRAVLQLVAALLLTGGVYAATLLVIAPRVGPALAPVVHVAAVIAIVVLLVPGLRWLGAAMDRVVLRRSRRQLAELQACIQSLSPELGRLECARGVLHALVRVLGLRGAGVILRDGTACAEGAVDVRPLQAVWPRDPAADSLPWSPFFGHELAAEALRDLLVEQRIAGVVPIVSTRRRWGDLLVSTGLLGSAFIEEHLEILETAARQLALLLDGTELLERAVAVERSLAQAEKLAAIGETAARIAHDIRNPVTAARSLAQQLANEPAARFREELHLILDELDRVERQVADLLQFARREDLRFESVDLGALVQATVAQLRPRLEAAGVSVALDLASGATARADRERLRHLIVNLVENAADALRGEQRRELLVRVTTSNGSAMLRVIDTGPGVPADALPHLFEPFFSLKPHGTGLGLAIAKRTVDAHGGRISAEVRPEGGMVFDVGLPLAGAEAA